MPKKYIIIPARFGSKRFPGKLMAELEGKPLISHTIETAKKVMSSVIVATDHKLIYDCAISHNVQAIITSSNHNSGTDRLTEVVTKLNFNDDDIVINLQGDEPLLPISLLNQVDQLLESDIEAGIATLIQPITSVDDLKNPNVVKVAMGENKKALYFSRAPIPYPRDEFPERQNSIKQGSHYRHLGLYAYRVATLKNIIRIPEHPLESLEKLEQLKPLAHGIKIIAEVASETPPHGVDTQEDLDRIRALLRN